MNSMQRHNRPFAISRVGLSVLLLCGGLAAASSGARAQSFYAADTYDNLVALVTAPNTTSTYATDPNGPSGLVLAPDGTTLYETNVSNGTISTITSGGTVTPFADVGSSEFLTALDFDSAGNLYVSDVTSNSILEFANSGGTPSTTYTTLATGLSAPQGLAYSSGFLYTANSGNNTISKIDTSNGSTTTFSSSASLNGPIGLAFDSSGNLYVANSSSIVELDSSGNAINTITDAGGPSSLGFDAGGNLFATEASSGDINEYTKSGSTVSSTPTTYVGGFSPQPGYLAGLNINGPSTSATPEPGSAALLFVGFVLPLARIRARRRRSAPSD